LDKRARETGSLSLPLSFFLDTILLGSRIVGDARDNLLHKVLGRCKASVK